MNYRELVPTRDLLNIKFKGQPLPHTDWTVKDFVIIPDENHDQRTHERFVYAVNNLGTSIHEMEEKVKQHPHLAIKIRLRNKEMKGFYFPQDLGFTNEYLENYRVG